MAGDAKPSAAYYVAISFLVVGLVAGLSLFLLLATRPHPTSASIGWTSSPVPCPSGTHGTSCYDFTVTNAGGGPAFASCELTPARGSQAAFANNSKVENFTLTAGQVREMLVTVVADQGSTLSLDAPAMFCSTASA